MHFSLDTNPILPHNRLSTEGTLMKNFEEKCREIESETGIELMDIYDDGDGTNAVYEDDGFLHINNGELRASFDVGDNQSLDADEQNERTRTILSALGLNVTNRALARR
jgi:hypothetical protein